MDRLKISDITADTKGFPVPVALLIDTAGRIRQINASGCELYNSTCSDLIDTNWFDHCLPEAWREGARHIFMRLIASASDGASYYICPALTSTGESPVLSWHLKVYIDRGGHVAGVLVTGVRIAENTAETNFLLQSAARNQAVLDNAIEAIISTETDGVITYANRTCETVFGYHEQELIGNNISCLMPQPYRSNHSDYVRHYLESGEKHIIGITRELNALRKNGSTVPIELTVTEINVNGIPSFTAIIRDISERKIAERRLKSSEEETRQVRDRLAMMDRLHIASEMSTGIAHELNQPLAAISLYAQAGRNQLRNGDSDPETLTQILTRIETQALRAGDVIRQMRSLIGKQESRYEPSDINKLIESTVELAQVDSDARQVRIDCYLDTKLPQRKIVRTQIQQVLINLIRNACDAMHAMPSSQRLIAITSSVSGSTVTIAVSDHGPGVEKCYLDRIFQPFFSGKPSGMGMGLAISQTIIKNHGGDLQLNRHYREGAEFRFTLPLVPLPKN